jgi:hypothetical protein
MPDGWAPPSRAITSPSPSPLCGQENVHKFAFYVTTMLSNALIIDGKLLCPTKTMTFVVLIQFDLKNSGFHTVRGASTGKEQSNFWWGYISVSMLVFWVATPCRLVGRYQRCEGTYCLHLQDELNFYQFFLWISKVSSRHWIQSWTNLFQSTLYLWT